MSGYPNLDLLCKALGHHGIRPEALEIIAKFEHMLNDELRVEYRVFMDDLGRMFAPVEKEEVDD
ncbi:hypothetical protein Cp1R7AA1_058 [Mesorhizobium phage Cp1R7A-A1]|nr:hypothetical protein Cp1R7AA1_058 [Mesorhizobium phage Cp1R7A-A1]